MRIYATAVLFLAFAMLSGACAGRQARTPSIPAPLLAEPAADEAATPVEVETVDPIAPLAAPPAPAPAAEELRITTQQAIDRQVAEDLAAHDAANRAAAEKLHRTRVSEPLPHEDEILAALRIDPERVRRIAREADAELTAMLAELDGMTRRSEPSALPDETASMASVRPRPKPKAARAAKDDGLAAVVGSLGHEASAPPAPAAPSIRPAPRGAEAAFGSESTDAVARTGDAASVPVFVPDPSIVTLHRAYAPRLIGATIAAIAAGILFGLLAGFIRNRRMRAVLEAAPDSRPDGIYIEEIVGGRVVSRNLIVPDASPWSEPEAHATDAETDALEAAWNAESDAMDETETDPRLEDTHDRFDVTDTPIEEVPSQPPPPPASDDSPRFASGSGRMITSSDDAPFTSGVAHVPEPPQERRSEPGFPPKVIVVEDASSTDLASAPSASAALN